MHLSGIPFFVSLPSRHMKLLRECQDLDLANPLADQKFSLCLLKSLRDSRQQHSTFIKEFRIEFYQLLLKHMKFNASE